MIQLTPAYRSGFIVISARRPRSFERWRNLINDELRPR